MNLEVIKERFLNGCEIAFNVSHFAYIEYIIESTDDGPREQSSSKYKKLTKTLMDKDKTQVNGVLADGKEGELIFPPSRFKSQRHVFPIMVPLTQASSHFMWLGAGESPGHP